LLRLYEARNDSANGSLPPLADHTFVDYRIALNQSDSFCSAALADFGELLVSVRINEKKFAFLSASQNISHSIKRLQFMGGKLLLTESIDGKIVVESNSQTELPAMRNFLDIHKNASIESEPSHFRIKMIFKKLFEGFGGILKESTNGPAMFQGCVLVGDHFPIQMSQSYRRIEPNKLAGDKVIVGDGVSCEMSQKSPGKSGGSRVLCVFHQSPTGVPVMGASSSMT
jgi:hypothetical protein